MGVFRFVGGALIAIVCAPETLAAGTVLALATAAGTAAHVVGGAMDDVEKDDARKEGEKTGFKNGYRKGGTDAAKRFADLMEKNDNLRIGAFALALYVANCDGELSEEERNLILEQIGHPRSKIISSDYVRNEMNQILKNLNNLNYSNIVEKYLNNLDQLSLSVLSDFITDLIKADNRIDPSERNFLQQQWYPYLNRCGISYQQI